MKCAKSQQRPIRRHIAVELMRYFILQIKSVPMKINGIALALQALQVRLLLAILYKISDLNFSSGCVHAYYNSYLLFRH